jgi:hypothetical protein
VSVVPSSSPSFQSMTLDVPGDLSQSSAEGGPSGDISVDISPTPPAKEPVHDPGREGLLVPT